MKTFVLSITLFLLFSFSSFSQIKIIQGIIRSEIDSIPLDSALVIIKNFSDDFISSNDPSLFQKTFYYTLTDSNGRFEFKNIMIPGLSFEETGIYEKYLPIEILRNGFYEKSEYVDINNDSLLNLDFTLNCYDKITVDTTINRPEKINPYKEYSNVSFFGGSILNNPGKVYDYNYKLGESIQFNFKISPVNYFGIEISPLIYRHYTTKRDSSNTKIVYPKEYFSSMQSGIGIFFKTHLFSWNKKTNALAIDFGLEYDCPWYYRFVNKPNSDTKTEFKNFHKYNEFYANARIGIIKGFYIKSQYRMTDIFRDQFTELPRWSMELQLVAMLSTRK